jgi:hypothetical protein
MITYLLKMAAWKLYEERFLSNHLTSSGLIYLTTNLKDSGFKFIKINVKESLPIRIYTVKR